MVEFCDPGGNLVALRSVQRERIGRHRTRRAACQPDQAQGTRVWHVEHVDEVHVSVVQHIGNRRQPVTTL